MKPTERQLRDDFFKHYIPLISDFRRDLAEYALGDFAGMPQPFVPLFGDGYERSAVRMVIVGQDTKGYRDLKSFLEDENADPGRA